MSYFTKTLTLLVLSFSPIIVAAQSCQTDRIPATTPTSRFMVNNNGTVIDTQTNLMWKRCREGLSGTNCTSGNATTYTWKQALKQAKAVNDSGGFAGYIDWRVPSVKELLSIIEKQCVEPSINLTVFPNTPSNWFWSSALSSNYHHYAWYVGFGNGSSSYSGRFFLHDIRLVRGGGSTDMIKSAGLF